MGKGGVASVLTVRLRARWRRWRWICKWLGWHVARRLTGSAMALWYDRRVPASGEEGRQSAIEVLA